VVRAVRRRGEGVRFTLRHLAESLLCECGAYEPRRSGVSVAQQRGIVVTRDDVAIGEYAVDPLVGEAVLVELKARRGIR
jgi:hypothetical protein